MRRRSLSSPPPISSSSDKRSRPSLASSNGTTTSAAESDLIHYEIHFIPSLSAFYVTNASSSLVEALGISYRLNTAMGGGGVIEKESVCLGRRMNLDEAICLGWVEDNLLSAFEGILQHEELLRAAGGVTKEWILLCANAVERDGICSNVELILRGHI